MIASQDTNDNRIILPDSFGSDTCEQTKSLNHSRGGYYSSIDGIYTAQTIKK